MATIVELLNLVCQQSLQNELAPFHCIDDLKHDMAARLWVEPLSEELSGLLYTELVKIKWRLVKREARHRARNIPSAEMDSRRDLDPAHSTSLNFEELGIIPHDDFEEEVMVAESGLHPEFENFTELAASGKYGSRATAYKRRSQSYRRLRAERAADCA
jgi:hypothetical protein